MLHKKTKYKYPEKITENFDHANFHIKYCINFFKKYLRGDILEVGGGCGSFTRNYFNKKISSLTITERDNDNIVILKKKFKNNQKVKVSKKFINKLQGKYDVILYLHVLEHIKNDNFEVIEAIKRLKKNGRLIIMVPAHKELYSNLDKVVGHYRRYEINYFKKKIGPVKLVNLKFLDFMGYILYFLNKIVFKTEKYPNRFKIFIWDKFFTPITIILDFIFGYKFGKAILAIYKK